VTPPEEFLRATPPRAAICALAELAIIPKAPIAASTAHLELIFMSDLLV
jgi:hypothetical protein